MNEYYVGTDDLMRCGKLPFAMISATRLNKDKNPKFKPATWMLDSGAFTQIAKHGEFTMTIEQYAKLINKYKDHGNLTCAVTQDYMCEPIIREVTGKTVREHQRMTTRRYFALLKELRKLCDVELMPVLQGWEPEDYLEHLRMYEKVWAHRRCDAGYSYRFNADSKLPEIPSRIGIGTMCKRNGSPSEVEYILDLLIPKLKKFQIHVFGLKKTALKHDGIRDRIHSADSFAYDFSDRFTQKIRKRLDRIKSAQKFDEEIGNQSVQLSLTLCQR